MTSRSPYRVFISRVSSEFEKVSAAIASDLRARGLKVSFQEDFTQGDTAQTWLDRLHEYIRDCHAVICLLGTRSGGFPSAEAVQPYAALLPADLPRASYTQWEFLFARHHQKNLFTYEAKATWQPDHAASASDDPDSQRRFTTYLRKTLCQISHGFATPLELQNLILRETWPDHSAAKPDNLPGGYIGQLFLGREDFLEKIRQSLHHAAGATAITQKPAATGISGLGGIGKTHAAVAYADRHRADYTALLFATADSRESLLRSLAQLCGVLRLEDHAPLPPDEPVRVQAALDWLAAHPGWLLIVDNVDTDEAALALTGLLGQLTRGHVLITSRLQDWSAQVRALDLEVLEENAATALLLQLTHDRRRPSPDPDSEALQLARLLGGLPLALHQAAGYINERRLTLPAYLARYEEEAAGLLQWFSALKIPYAGPEKVAPRPIFITWKTSFDQLDDNARFWLLVFSQFSPEPIPEFLLQPHPEANDEETRALIEGAEALVQLEKFSLVTRDVAQPRFKVHRLVQQITRLQADAEDRYDALKTAIGWIQVARPGNPHDFESWPKWILLQPHAALLCDQASDDHPPPRLSWLLSEFGSFLKGNALVRRAESYYHRALAIDRITFGDEHSRVAAHLSKLANLLVEMDRFAEAEPLQREALSINIAAYGDEHPKVANSLNNLAHLLQETNRFAEAEPLYREALRIDIATLGGEHPMVANRLGNLGMLLRTTNRLAEAETMLREAFRIRRAVLGGDHPDVALSLNNLASFLQDKDQLAEAETMQREALRINRRHFGDNHPSVSRSLSNLATLLIQTERNAESEPLLREALRIDREVYGEGHSSLARHQYNLAMVLRSTNRLAEAEVLMREAWLIERAARGDDDAHNAHYLRSLAGIIRETRGEEEAEPLIREALRIDRAAYGDDHTSVAMDLNTLAVLLKNTGRLAEAEPMYREALRISHDSLGAGHSLTETVAGNLEILLAEKAAARGGVPG